MGNQIAAKDARIRELEQENKEVRLDCLNYKNWTSQMIATWIRDLDDGAYEDCWEQIRERLVDDGVEGSDLADINGPDNEAAHRNWKRFGVKKYGHRKRLIEH